MATLINMLGVSKGEKAFRLYKKITTIGSRSNSDLCIQHADIEPEHAIIVFDGDGYVIKASGKAMVLVNGERIKSARLNHGDSVRIGRVPFIFDLHDSILGEASGPKQITEIENYRKLYEFTERLSNKYDLDELLNTLIDLVIEISGADNGFLILRREDRDLDFTVARNVNQQTIKNADMYVSDSIIRRVLESGKPIIVSNALADEQFKNSASVLSLKLTSVMCVPIKESGELFGIIYVGNNKVVNLFGQDMLQVLEIFAAQAGLIIKNALLVRELRRDSEELRHQLDSMKFGSIVGTSESMREIFRQIERISRADVPVLIMGETGTGKELVAREVHNKSSRSSGPFVVINCAAIPETLLESELFGHKRGSFTGALYDKPGKFKLANGGTLFLDEIGEMPLTLQVKILRAIEEGMITPIGASKPEPIDIRIIAATNRNLETEIKEGRFREDLFYRLNVITFKLPPLRERGDDIEMIARYFLVKYAKEFGREEIKGFTPEALFALRRYRWPGNVRELENRIKKALILCERTLIGADDLGLEKSSPEEFVIKPLAVAKEEWQTNYILRALEVNDWNRTKTAKMLEVDPRTVFRYLEKIEPEKKAPRRK